MSLLSLDIFTDNQLTVLAHDVSQEQEKRLKVHLEENANLIQVLAELKAESIKDFIEEGMTDRAATQLMLADVRSGLEAWINTFSIE